MRYTSFVALLLLLFGSVAYGQASRKTAKAEFINAKGEKVGSAKLTEVKDGVRINLSVSNLPPGTHAFHIHAAGKCEPPDFKSAGPHFNPHGKKHGTQNPEGPHLGDLPNLVVAASGKARVKVVAAHVTLGEGENSFFHSGGTALVIHADADDYKTDPAGNAGARIACGVITR